MVNTTKINYWNYCSEDISSHVNVSLTVIISASMNEEYRQLQYGAWRITYGRFFPSIVPGKSPVLFSESLEIFLDFLYKMVHINTPLSLFKVLTCSALVPEGWFGK